MSVKETVTRLKARLPGASWTDDSDKISPHLHEWRDRWVGQTPLLLMPSSTREVVEIVRICNRAGTPLTIQGGNTGLVGGQIPQGEILLSTHRLNAVREMDRAGSSILCEAGVTLKQAQDAALAARMKFPLSLASQDSCTIGGNLATNAGGVHVIKYGTMRKLTFGVEAVLADGSLIDETSALLKDNTGYHLSDLLIGSEGTLGVITAARLKCVPAPKAVVRAILGFDDVSKPLATLSWFQEVFSISMFELMPHFGLELVLKHIPGMRAPFDAPSAWYVVMEVETAYAPSCKDNLEYAIEDEMNEFMIENAVIAQSEAQKDAFLALRENLSAAQKPEGACIKHDISLPLKHIDDFIAQAAPVVQQIVPGARPLPFGHLGDGNLHYNIVQPEVMEARDFMACEADINAAVYDLVTRFGGSISAEHGIGILKKAALQRYGDSDRLAAMRRVKQALDPAGLFNPRVLL